MESDQVEGSQSITGISEVDVGDVVYLEENHSVYWVSDLTQEEITFINRDGDSQSVGLERFKASIQEHIWILQSKAPPSSDHLQLDPDETDSN